MKVKKIVGLVVLATVLALGGYVALARISGHTSASAEIAGQAVKVQRGNLEVTISADGNVEAPHQAKLSFESTGIIKELKVRTGDEVKKGQVLAGLETADLERAMVDAEAGVRSAQAAVKDTVELYDLSAQAQAEAAVAAAQAQVKMAQKAFQDVQIPYNLSPYSPADVAQAEATVAAASARVKAAQKAFQDVQVPYNLSPYTASDVTQADALVAAAQAQVRSAESALSKVQVTLSNEDVAHYQAAVDSARSALAVAQQEVVTARLSRDRNVANAQETLRQQQENYKLVIGLPLTGDVFYLDPAIILGTDAIPKDLKAAYQSLLKARDDARIAQEQGDKSVASAESSVASAGDSLKKAREELDRKMADVPVNLAVRQHQLDDARASLATAQEELKKRKAGPDPLEIAGRQLSLEDARASLVKAKEDLKKIKAGPDPLEIASRQLSLENAQATLTKAQEELKKKKAGPDATDMALRKAQLASAQVALDRAREKLEKATLVAPFDGVVASVNNVKVWDRVGPNDIIVQLIDPREFEVQVLVDEMDVYQVKPGQAVKVDMDALPDTRLEGKIAAISPMAQRQTGVINYPVVIRVQPPERLALKDGLTASATITVDSKQNVLLVPAGAVSKSGTNTVVRVLVNGQPVERIVRVGTTQDGQAEILEGLSEGEVIAGRTP